MSRFIVLFTLLIFVCGCGSGDKPAADATPPATSTEPETLIVDASSTGPLDASSKIFTRIGVAIGRAKSGDTIKIRPGNYPETLEIEKALKLIGDGPADKIVIVGKSMATIAIGADVSISNLTLRHTTVDKVSLDVVRGKVIVDNCDISNEVSSGVRTLPNRGSPLKGR